MCGWDSMDASRTTDVTPDRRAGRSIATMRIDILVGGGRTNRAFFLAGDVWTGTGVLYPLTRAAVWRRR